MDLIKIIIQRGKYQKKTTKELRRVASGEQDWE